MYDDDLEDYDELDVGDVDLVDDVNGISELVLASGSNAVAAYSVTDVSIYQAQVLDRLDVISTSAILTTCLVFLLFLRNRKG